MLQYVIDVFLPSGFPQSVTEDYVEYQIFVSLPFFSSSFLSVALGWCVCVCGGVGEGRGKRRSSKRKRKEEWSVWDRK